MCSCRVPPSRLPSVSVPPKRTCMVADSPISRPEVITGNRCKPLNAPLPHIGGRREALRRDASAKELHEVLEGFPGTDIVRPYVVDTVRMLGGLYQQRGSAPNFDGGLGTLCTCKHQMRSRYSAESWASGVWVLGLTGMSRWRYGEQTFYYLMRIGEAYESQSELVSAFERQGRKHVLAAKDSRTSELGDIFLPNKPLGGAQRYNPQNYHRPMEEHAHSQRDDPLHWHNDIFYGKSGGRQPPVLVGDPDLTFVWTRPLVKRRSPVAIRDYENWTLARLRAVILGVDE
jgi:hypothetical protein